LGNEISARYHQALAADDGDGKVLQLWAKSIDVTIERYLTLAPSPADKGQQDYLAAMLEFYLHCFQAFADTRTYLTCLAALLTRVRHGAHQAADCICDARR
jgi:hypothetical protein